MAASYLQLFHTCMSFCLEINACVFYYLLRNTILDGVIPVVNLYCSTPSWL